ncbi:MAG: hypothetical protein HYU26_17155 [Candidatus Rokubacteria bacterium]|nr:hypothetical protein [Candidatus Rokubacteria bacterium]
MRPSIGLTDGGGGGKTRTWAAAPLGSVASAASPATPVAAVRRKSRRLAPSGAASVARGFTGWPQVWPQQLVSLQRGSVNGLIRTSWVWGQP